MGEEYVGPRRTTEKVEISEEAKRAMRAVAQWHLGDRQWADEFISIAEADDPVAVANRILRLGWTEHEETVDSIMGSVRSDHG
jgi:hypothetical protein